MEDKLVTLAILTYSKAQILKNVLENEGIEAYIHNVNLIQPVISSGVRVRIKESDLPHALRIIESSTWLSDDVIKEHVPTSEPHVTKILIPVDFSDYSLQACQFGFSFAAAVKNAEIVLLHVYFSPIYVPTLSFHMDDDPSFNMENQEAINSIIETVHKELHKLSETIEKKIAVGEFPKVPYHCILRDGVPEEEILAYAKEIKPQIIIMGTRGSSQKEMELLGSVTAEVIERSRGFVYAIPEKTPLKTFQDIKNSSFGFRY